MLWFCPQFVLHMKIQALPKNTELERAASQREHEQESRAPAPNHSAIPPPAVLRKTNSSEHRAEKRDTWSASGDDSVFRENDRN